jgi:hypothetical protein
MNTDAVEQSVPINYARRTTTTPPATQYELPGLSHEMHGDVPVAVPPLWHAVVTARLAFQPDTLKRAQERLEACARGGRERFSARTHRNLPVANQIPFGSELFLGFTSSHVDGLAQGNLPSFETLPGYTNATPESYFAGGTAMHLSHIALDLDGWYRFGYRDRLHRMFNPRRSDPEGNLSPSQAPETATFAAELDADAANYRLVGHNEQMQHLSRTDQELTTAYGQRLARGTTIFLRHDFDTIDNPFEFWAGGTVDPAPCPGVHFVGMASSSQLFEALRREMDAIELQRKYNLPDANVGFTRFLTTTHRQNFHLPPRAHRSFPLAEL